MDTTTVTCTALPAVTWQVWSGNDLSLNHTIPVFRIAVSEAAGWLSHLDLVLSPYERARAERYRRPDDQIRFRCTRGLLRLILGKFMGQPPDELQFVQGMTKKPALVNPIGYQFNVSHSGDWLLIAIGRIDVGVDLEWISPEFPFQDVSQISFSPREQHYIESCSNPRLGFYQLWTRKEALVKATGKGMDDAFDQIPSLPGIHRTEATLIGGVGHWKVTGFAVADGYPAAIAYYESGPALLVPVFYTLDSGRLIGDD